MPVLVLFALVAIDFSQIQSARAKVQASVDAAILAASVEANKLDDLDNENEVLKALSENFDHFLEVNFKNGETIKLEIRDVTYDPSSKKVETSVSFIYPSLVRSFTGNQQMRYVASASTHLIGKERNSLSMMLVLDKSGSMGWRGRMDALKTAVNELAKQFREDDPEQKYIRVGAIAYDSRNFRRTVRPAWGPDAANVYTQRLRPGGGTNSSGAVRTAYQNLRGNREQLEHDKRNRGELRRVILFMTDGANSRSSYDSATLYYCRLAKRENIQVYTVAFQAPRRGRRLLQTCASSPSHYFLANDANDLIAAFKLIGEAATRQLSISS